MKQLTRRPGYIALRATGIYEDGSPRLLREISNEGIGDAEQKAMAESIKYVFFFPLAALRFFKALLWLRKLIGLRPY